MRGWSSRMTGITPFLLLDEIAAHLDPDRRAALFAALDGARHPVPDDRHRPDAVRRLGDRAQVVHGQGRAAGMGPLNACGSYGLPRPWEKVPESGRTSEGVVSAVYRTRRPLRWDGARSSPAMHGSMGRRATRQERRPCGEAAPPHSVSPPPRSVVMAGLGQATRRPHPKAAGSGSNLSRRLGAETIS